MSRPEIRLDEHGFPIPHELREHDVDSQVDLIPNHSVEPPRRWFHARWVRGGLFLSFIGCVLFFGFGKEIRPWFNSEMGEFFAERSVDKMLDNDLPGALADADSACRWAPDESEYLKLRGDFRLRNGDPQGAIDDFDEFIKKKPRDPEGYLLRAFALARLNRFDEALADMNTVLEKNGPHHASSLNSRAYLCALGNIQLEQGLADIEKAIKQGHEDNAAFLDTRGYLHFLLGNLEEAERDLDQAIAITQFEQQELHRLRNARFINHKQLNYQLRLADENLAVMHYHRGELYEAQGRETEAKREKRLGLSLGYDREKGVY